ncbi:glutamine amidotransferase-like class 1 domain-containing protein 3, mitochondrial isoform X1 [Nerophis ophidion]|uniref:glutamine amidotransferase-like class 1 domain-containing protein 3, mitochondrial isoform X1 n=1 Tax=Nerophis ophidion TaxID=159077 RepID=UPI002AE078CD|nr:glutamine amidotransferase-like class 1 domain-containing protein 3, mitochondrial isoform X1 [Nerophis ophidion]
MKYVPKKSFLTGAETHIGQTEYLQIFPSTMAKRVAVILSGCGVYDGTEIHEASAVLVHLSRAGAKVQMFAPNADQMHVVNHCEGKPTEEKRNILQESARIARGDVTDLAKLDVSAFDALIIPVGGMWRLQVSLREATHLQQDASSADVHGGFGVAKNLSDWAVKNKNLTVKPAVVKILQDFHKSGKPLGLCCISPVLAAKVLPGCELTVGHDTESDMWPHAQTALALKEMGCKHVNKNVDQAHVDLKNKLVTTPAFMGNAPIHKVFDGIGVMVQETLKLA